MIFTKHCDDSRKVTPWHSDTQPASFTAQYHVNCWPVTFLHVLGSSTPFSRSSLSIFCISCMSCRQGPTVTIDATRLERNLSALLGALGPRGILPDQAARLYQAVQSVDIHVKEHRPVNGVSNSAEFPDLHTAILVTSCGEIHLDLERQ